MQACIKPVKVSVVVWILKRFAEYHRELSWHIIKKKMMLNSHLKEAVVFCIQITRLVRMSRNNETPYHKLTIL